MGMKRYLPAGKVQPRLAMPGAQSALQLAQNFPLAARARRARRDSSHPWLPTFRRASGTGGIVPRTGPGTMVIESVRCARCGLRPAGPVVRTNSRRGRGPGVPRPRAAEPGAAAYRAGAPSSEGEAARRCLGMTLMVPLFSITAR